MNRSRVAGAALIVLGLGLGCVRTESNPSHCANLLGDQTCEAALHGRLFCSDDASQCNVDPYASPDGCVATQPSEACHVPCGQQNPSACDGVANETGVGEDEGTTDSESGGVPVPGLQPCEKMGILRDGVCRSCTFPAMDEEDECSIVYGENVACVGSGTCRKVCKTDDDCPDSVCFFYQKQNPGETEMGTCLEFEDGYWQPQNDLTIVVADTERVQDRLYCRGTGTIDRALTILVEAQEQTDRSWGEEPEGFACQRILELDRVEPDLPERPVVVISGGEKPEDKLQLPALRAPDCPLDSFSPEGLLVYLSNVNFERDNGEPVLCGINTDYTMQNGEILATGARAIALQQGGVNMRNVAISQIIETGDVEEGVIYADDAFVTMVNVSLVRTADSSSSLIDCSVPGGILMMQSILVGHEGDDPVVCNLANGGGGGPLVFERMISETWDEAEKWFVKEGGLRLTSQISELGYDAEASCRVVPNVEDLQFPWPTLYVDTDRDGRQRGDCDQDVQGAFAAAGNP